MRDGNFVSEEQLHSVMVKVLFSSIYGLVINKHPQKNFTFTDRELKIFREQLLDVVFNMQTLMTSINTEIIEVQDIYIKVKQLDRIFQNPEIQKKVDLVNAILDDYSFCISVQNSLSGLCCLTLFHYR